jgi:dTMP kinase
MHSLKRGVLISFEGVEGSGKTTQAEALVKWLTQSQVPHVFIREPGSTSIGEAIREILLDPANKDMHPKCEVLLFLAARSQLTYEKILAALREKKVVVADRFSDSTVAYQVYGHNLPARMVAILNRFATAGTKPDLTFLVDIDVSTGRQRSAGNDRMEKRAAQYHERVREAYLRLARRAKKRIKILDGSKPVEVLNNEVVVQVKQFLARKGHKP